jgi:hypothetical protein
MTPKIILVTAQPNWTIKVQFSDGVAGEIALKDRLFGPVFEPLKDIKFFEKVSIDEFGVICWPNGADLAPDAVYERLKTAEGIAANV